MNTDLWKAQIATIIHVQNTEVLMNYAALYILTIVTI